MICPKSKEQCKAKGCAAHGCYDLAFPEPPAAPTLNIARTPLNDMARDAARYRRLRDHVYATANDHDERYFSVKIGIDWGDIPDGTDAEMLDAAMDGVISITSTQPCKSDHET